MKLVKNYDEWKFVFPQEMDSVFDEYWEAIEYLGNDEKECQKRLKKIIRRFPENHLDAYNHLSISFRNQNNASESLHFALTSYLLGKNSFPNSFDETKDEILWIAHDNRPFLRACQNLGLEFLQRNQIIRATELFEENLKYNPIDNQGIRYLLLESYLKQKNFVKFKKLLDKYDDDFSVDFLYGRLIYDILENESKLTDNLIIDAKKCNEFVISEIAKDKHIEPKPHVSDGIGIGSEQEAYEYWIRNKKILNLKKVKDFFKNAKKTMESDK